MAELIALAASALAAIIIFRAAGPTIAGVLALTTTVLYLATVLVGGGMPSLGAQLAASFPDEARPILRKAIIVRLGYATVWVLTLESLLTFIPLEEPLHELLVWTTPGAFLVALRNEWLLVGRGAIGAAAVVRAASALVGLAVSVLITQGSIEIPGLAIYIISAPGVAALLSTGLALATLEASTASGYASERSLRSFAISGFQYLKADGSIFVNNNSDRLFLYVFGGAAITGTYDAAYKLIQPFAAISGVVRDSMFLSLVRTKSLIDNRVTFRRFVDWMFIFTVPVGFVTVGYGDDIVKTVYGVEFLNAAPILAILGWAVTIGYLSGVLVIPFSAWHAPRQYGNSMLAGSVANIALNLALIPSLLGVGAAVATIGARLTVVLAAARSFRVLSDYPVMADFAVYCLAAGTALVIGLGASTVLPLPWFAGLALFCITYGAIVLIVRGRSLARLYRQLRDNS